MLVALLIALPGAFAALAELSLSPNPFPWEVTIDFAGVVAAFGAVWRRRTGWWAILPLVAAMLISTAAGNQWAVTGNWAAVILVGVLAWRGATLWPAALAALAAVLAPTPLTVELLSTQVVVHMLVVLAVVVSGAFGLVLRQANRRQAAERATAQAEVARDIAHDTVAHEVAGIVVTAQAARYANDPDFAAHALEAIEEAGNWALNSRHAVVATNRNRAAITDDDLHALFDRFPDPINATVHTRATGPELAAIGMIASEALTNILRHAPGAHTTATITDDDHGTALRITNTLPTTTERTPLGPGTGVGTESMAHRAQALGGTCTSQRDGAEWVVAAHILWKAEQ